MDLQAQLSSPNFVSSSLKELLEPKQRAAWARTGVFLSVSSSSFLQKPTCTDRREWRLHDPYSRNESPARFRVRAMSAAAVGGKHHSQDLPPVLPKRKKKPFVSPPKRGGFLVKKGPKERVLHPPANGLLVPKLVPVAHEVFEARATLLQLLIKLMQVVPVKVCKFCSHPHVGPVGHRLATCDGPHSNIRKSQHVWIKANINDVFADLDTYHLFERLTTIKHEARFDVERLPALVELCIQAGVDLPEYPAKRRTQPVRVIGKRILEYDSRFELDDDEDDDLDTISAGEKGIRKGQDDYDVSFLMGEEKDSDVFSDTDDEVAFKYHEREADSETREQGQTLALENMDVVDMAEMALKAWETIRNGAKRLMAKYPVRVCGYCPEVHVGPRGHKVKMCGEFKHQWRAGQHGWQEATLDDLIPPKYVWHVRDPQTPILRNELRRYYGQAPCVVELCVQAGAAVPDAFKPMMRLDVVIPDTREVHNVV